ncbi:MAG TPA: hypothetical protein VFU22_06970 [Roseiflexaceae bacterium]|nr:hypothetical protein [Roseiflexaceae bacterium]
MTLLTFAVILVAALAMHISQWKDEYLGSDIKSIYEMSRDLSLGNNPYDSILPGRRDDEKYATYLPLFYIFGALIHRLGAQEFLAWIGVWRFGNLAANVGIGTLLFVAFYQRRLLLMAIFATLFWFFNRWTLYITVNGQIDLAPVVCLVASLLLFRTQRRLSFLLLGISLALKHIGIFVVPLYLIWTWQSAEQNRLRDVALAAIWIAILPALISLPFVLWNPTSFVASMAYSLTREAENHFRVASLDELLTVMYPWFTGFLARLPMIALMLLIYLGALRGQISLFFSVLLVMSVFIDFDSVVFRQYFTWLVPMVLLALCDVFDSLRAGRLAGGAPMAQQSDRPQ